LQAAAFLSASFCDGVLRDASIVTLIGRSSIVTLKSERIAIY
jgi:hypothetical protein